MRLVVDVVTAIKDLRALRAGIQQLSCGRNGSVVQIGRTQPNTVERHSSVAVRSESMRHKYFGGHASRSQSSTRRMFWRSKVGGYAPVPNAALRFLSWTEVLLPSQCNCMPSRFR